MVKNEKGSLFVFSAVILPMLIILSAFIIDGCWYLYHVSKLDSVLWSSSYVISNSIDYDRFEMDGTLIYDKEQFLSDLQNELNYHLEGVSIKRIVFNDKIDSAKALIEVRYTVEFFIIDKFGISDKEVHSSLTVFYP